MKQYSLPDLNGIRRQTAESARIWHRNKGEFQDTPFFETRIMPPPVAKEAVYLSFGLNDSSAPHKLIVFAAYVHRFANTLQLAQTGENPANPAFDILCTDPCAYWTDVGNHMGLESITAGAEDIPKREGTIAHVGYEPYPVAVHMSGIIAIIRALAQTESGYGEFYAQGRPREEDRIDTPRFQLIQKIYGAEIRQIDTKAVRSLVVTQGTDSKLKSRLDLRIMEIISNYTADGIWLNELFQHVGHNEGSVVEALERLEQLANGFLEFGSQKPPIREINVARKL